MKWDVRFLPEADDDLSRLDNGVRRIVLKAIKKVQENPLPQEEGGYGKLLGHKQNIDLSGFLKIKILNAGVRVASKLLDPITSGGVSAAVECARLVGRAWLRSLP